MRIITISREFGSGGRELGKRIADILGFDYYDSEIITAVAKQSGLDPRYVEHELGDHGWQQFPVTYRSTIASAAYIQSGRIELLLEQRKVIEQIAQLGKDFVIVGRNADVILEEYDPFNIFAGEDRPLHGESACGRAHNRQGDAPQDKADRQAALADKGGHFRLGVGRPQGLRPDRQHYRLEYKGVGAGGGGFRPASV